MFEVVGVFLFVSFFLASILGAQYIFVKQMNECIKADSVSSIGTGDT